MKFNKLLLSLLLLFTLSYAGSKKIELNFSGLEINEFIKVVSKITNKNILISSPIAGKVDFVSDHGISKEELFALLQSVLQSKGFTLVQGEGFLSTVRVSDASKEAPPLQEGKLGQIHTQVIQVESADANTLSAQLRFLLSKSGKLVVSRDNNTFIVTDYPRNTQLIKKLIKQLDQKRQQDIAFIPLKHVKVSTIYPEFIKIIGALYNQKIVQQKVGIFKNDATNMLIAVGKSEHIDRIKKFVEHLDKPDKVTKQQLAMITLKNANAEDVVKILTDIIAKKAYPKGVIKPSISADKELNALIFIATGEEIEEYKKLLAELDKEREQVYVKARVIEISKTRADSLGMQYGLNAVGYDGTSLYTLSANLGGSALSATDASTALSTFGFGSATISVGLNLNLLLQNGAAETLSEPSILCMNNQASSIYVGQTVSVISGTTQGNAANSLARNTFSREDVGLTLKVTPRIADDDKVTLNVEAKLEDIVPGSTEGLPTTTKREIKTSAMVTDGERVIIGGLIRKKVSTSISKIPLLGDIPIIGWLFKNEHKTEDEVNLVVLLTPYIVKKSSNLTQLREKISKLNALENRVINQELKALEVRRKAQKKDD